MTDQLSLEDDDLDILLDQFVAAATGTISENRVSTDGLTVPLCVACPEIVDVLNQVRGPGPLGEPTGASDFRVRRAIEAIEEGSR